MRGPTDILHVDPELLLTLREWCEERREETDDLKRIGDPLFYRGRDFAFHALAHNFAATHGRIEIELAGRWNEKKDKRIDQFAFLRGAPST